MREVGAIRRRCATLRFPGASPSASSDDLVLGGALPRLYARGEGGVQGTVAGGVAGIGTARRSHRHSPPACQEGLQDALARRDSIV